MIYLPFASMSTHSAIRRLIPYLSYTNNKLWALSGPLILMGSVLARLHVMLGRIGRSLSSELLLFFQNVKT